MNDTDGFWLRVPREASSLALIRAVVGSVASRADLTYSQIDDLRIAVAEAAAAMVAAPGSAISFAVHLDPEPGRIRVELVADPALDAPISFPPGSVPALIVSGLTDDLQVGEDDRGSWVRLEKGSAS